MNFLAESKRARGKAKRFARNAIGRDGKLALLGVGVVAAGVAGYFFFTSKTAAASTPPVGTTVTKTGSSAGTWTVSTTIPLLAEFYISVNNPPAAGITQLEGLATLLGAKTYPVGTTNPYAPVDDGYGTTAFRLMGQNNTGHVVGPLTAPLVCWIKT
jgi:hypothetical protein